MTVALPTPLWVAATTNRGSVPWDHGILDRHVKIHPKSSKDRSGRRSKEQIFLVLLIEKIINPRIKLHMLVDLVRCGQIPDPEGRNGLGISHVAISLSNVATFQIRPDSLDRLITENRGKLVQRPLRETSVLTIRQIIRERVSVLHLQIQASDPWLIPDEFEFPARFHTLRPGFTGILRAKAKRTCSSAHGRIEDGHDKIAISCPEVARTEEHSIVEQ